MVALYQIFLLIQTLHMSISFTISAIDPSRYAFPEFYSTPSAYYIVVLLILTYSFQDQHVALSVFPLNNISRYDLLR
jgi:hypothetical protein